MNLLNSTISTHLKNKHLSFQDRVTLQVLRRQGQSLRQIAAINQRQEFGHREGVLGHKTKDDDVLLTLYERMTRKFMIIPIKNKRLLAS